MTSKQALGSFSPESENPHRAAGRSVLDGSRYVSQAEMRYIEMEVRLCREAELLGIRRTLDVSPETVAALAHTACELMAEVDFLKAEVCRARQLAAQPAASQPGISAPAEMDHDLHDDRQAPTPAVSGEPETGGVACQACGGVIEGWTCQSCGRLFRETASGSLIMDPRPTPPVDQSRGEVTPDAHTAAVEAFRDWFSTHTGRRIFYRNASKAVDRILAALSQGVSDV